MITTKKGKVGKPVINFSTKLTYSPKLNIDRLNLLNSEEKVGLELDLLASGYPYRETKGEVYRIISGLGELNNFKDGGWNALSSSAQSAINKLKATNTDWSDTFSATHSHKSITCLFPVVVKRQLTILLSDI